MGSNRGCQCADRVRGDRSRPDRLLAFVAGYPGPDRSAARFAAGADVVFSSVEPGETRIGRGVVLCACEPGHTHVGAGIGVVYGDGPGVLDHLRTVRGSVIVIALYPGTEWSEIAEQAAPLVGNRPTVVRTFGASDARLKVRPLGPEVFGPWPWAT